MREFTRTCEFNSFLSGFLREFTRTTPIYPREFTRTKAREFTRINLYIIKPIKILPI